MGGVVKALGSGVAKALGRSMTAPSPPEAPPAPSTQTNAVQQVQQETAQRRSKARGLRSTILSQMMPDGAPALKDTYGS
jgi:hypothetical protein